MTKETDPSIVFHTDATQTVGNLPINLSGEFQHVDLLSFSGHKLHAPKGIAALCEARHAVPAVSDRRPSEEGRRAGTENVPYIVGLAEAVKLATANYDAEESHVRCCATASKRRWRSRFPASRSTANWLPAPQHAQHLLPLRGRRRDALSTER